MKNTNSSKACMNRSITVWEKVCFTQGRSSKEAQRLQQRLALNLFNQLAD